MLKSGLFSVVFKVEGVEFREEYNLLYITEEDYVKNSTLCQQATNAVSRIHNDLILEDDTWNGK